MSRPLVVRYVAGGRDYGETWKHRGGRREAKPSTLAKREQEWACEVFRRAQEKTPAGRGVHGACRGPGGEVVGADGLFERWCLRTGLQPVGYPAAFECYGKAAAARRIEAMLDDFADAEYRELILLPGGMGTDLTLRIAEAKNRAHEGVQIHIYDLRQKGPRQP